MATQTPDPRTDCRLAGCALMATAEYFRRYHALHKFDRNKYNREWMRRYRINSRLAAALAWWKRQVARNPIPEMYE